MSNSLDPMAFSQRRSPVHRNSQARILEWVVVSFTRDLPAQGQKLLLLHWLAGSFFTPEPSVLHQITTYSEYSLEGMMLKLKLQYFGHLV